jgi:DNA-binding LacI/PurR family transcriptional regulator
MTSRKRTRVGPPKPRDGRSPTLRELAELVGLSPSTVSVALRGKTSVGVSAETQDLVRRKAREIGYRPNFLARSLRTSRTYSVGVMIPGVGEGYNVVVLRGIEDYLAQKGYYYYVASHYLQPRLVEEYAQGFIDRAADGLIVVSAPWEIHLSIPVATVSSYHEVGGSSSILLDHAKAVDLALRHLVELGHRHIAFIKGPAVVPDAEVRWRAITATAERLGIDLRPRLIEAMPSTPDSRLGYEAACRLLDSGETFTALFAFNDVSAMEAVHALTDRGLNVPEDVSVVGFDDIESAGYMGPGLTTVRQPLHDMGWAAAESVLDRIGRPREEWADARERIVVEPQLVVRETTAPPRAGTSS